MAKYVTETLKEINDNPTLLTTQHRKTEKFATTPEGIILEAAFNPAYRFCLPAGEPPYKPSDKPIGLADSSLSAEVSKFYLYLCKDLPKAKRESLFIQALERVSAGEAKVLIAVKDQNLTALYPNITPRLVCDAGYIPESAVHEVPVRETVVVPLDCTVDSETVSEGGVEATGSTYRAVAEEVVAEEAPSVKRKPGRPKGSKNKPKPAPKN